MGRRATATDGFDAPATAGVTLDAGALIGLERSNQVVLALLDHLERISQPVAVPAGALAQAWRGSRRQHRLALLLGSDVEIAPLDLTQSLAISVLLAATGSSDVVDASVVITARDRRHWVATSDPGDLRRLDPDLPIIEV